jgi:hypothetical protein
MITHKRYCYRSSCYKLLEIKEDADKDKGVLV